jgi:hypothetical protein
MYSVAATYKGSMYEYGSRSLRTTFDVKRVYETGHVHYLRLKTLKPWTCQFSLPFFAFGLG